MSEANQHIALAEAVHASGLKQDWIAAQLCVTKNTVSRWVNGKSSPTLVKQEKLAKLLGRNVEDLFFVDTVTLKGER